MTELPPVCQCDEPTSAAALSTDAGTGSGLSAAAESLAERCRKYPRYSPPVQVNTSALYRTLHLPARFEKSCKYRALRESTNQLLADTQLSILAAIIYHYQRASADIFGGYGAELNDCANPLYRTTSGEYGWHPPNAHTVPQRFHPRTNEFSDLLGKCGMYRNYSLNTVMDASVF